MEVEGRLDAMCHSFERVGGPKRGIGGSRCRFCLGDVGAGLSVVLCRSSADSRRVWVFFHRRRRRKELM